MSLTTLRAALCVAGLAFSSQTHADELAVPKDGWSSWQVAAMEDSPSLCCWTGWNEKDVSRGSCKLDEQRGNTGSRDHAKTDVVRVYARLAGGKVDRLRVLDTGCPVESATPIRDLGTVAPDDSARWLVALSKREEAKSPDFHENVLGALAMHRSDLAQETLVSIARGDGRIETRKNAVFWLALVRGIPGADVATSVMFNDKDPDMREHATFAVTQSRSPRVTQDLIRLGNTDKAGEVRAQAWFWLAQTGAVEAEGALNAALRKDSNDHVREQAIFALSQLPDERATKALVAVAEDRTLTSEQRKRAVFWLAQSEAEAAQKYLEKVLAGNVAR